MRRPKSLHNLQHDEGGNYMAETETENTLLNPQALESRTPLFPHLVPPAIMVWIFVWKYILEPFIYILQHLVLQLSRSTNFCF